MNKKRRAMIRANMGALPQASNKQLKEHKLNNRMIAKASTIIVIK